MSNSEKQRLERLEALGFKREASTPEGEPKMSEVILKLAEPLMKKHGTDAKRMNAILALAVAGWNKAMFPADKQAVIEKDLIDSFIPKDMMAQDMVVIVEVMDVIADRREELYPDLRKLIVDYEVIIAGGKLTLNVSSAPLPDLDGNAK